MNTITEIDDLNPTQRAAVMETDAPLFVLAGAGSGKTRVITTKMAYLIHNRGLKPAQVVAVTFTNKAAREMKSRTAGLLGSTERRGLRVSTFHTLGLNFLRQELKAAGLKAGFSIFDMQDSATLVREIAHQNKLEEAESVRFQISRWKNDLLTPESVAAQCTDMQEVLVSKIFATYERALKAYNAVDFDDLILLPTRLLQEDDGLRARWQNRIRHLLIDEYQDTNTCQYQLIRLLVGVDGGLTAVGDDDQSIYAWRGARPENLLHLQEDFPRLKVIKLEQNYRSTTSILKSANHLISHNSHLHEKRLWSTLGEGESLRVLPCKSADDEAACVSSEILRQRFKAGCKYSDFAILYRGNHQARPFERWLREQNIPYQISGGTSFFEHQEIRDIMAYLRLFVNPDDDAAFLRVVNIPRRGIGSGTLETLGHYAQQRRISLLAAAGELGLAQLLSPRALKALRRFSDWIEEMSLATRDPEAEIKLLLRHLLEAIQYQAWLEEQYDNPKAVARRMENIHELIAWLNRLQEDEPGKGLAARVAHLTLVGILDRNNKKQDQDAVHLMTLHAAKGLEFSHVFMVGMEEELLPHRASLESGDIEEERRLAYVGITRAQRTLTLTYCTKRNRYGEEIECEPSRFLEELPHEYLDWRREPASLEEKREVSRVHLASIKALLE